MSALSSVAQRVLAETEKIIVGKEDRIRLIVMRRMTFRMVRSSAVPSL